MTRRTRTIADEVPKERLPLSYFLALMNDETVPAQRRDWAASQAAPFCHPKLNAMAVHNHNTDQPVVTTINILSVPTGQFIDTPGVQFDPPLLTAVEDNDADGPPSWRTPDEGEAA